MFGATSISSVAQLSGSTTIEPAEESPFFKSESGHSPHMPSRPKGGNETDNKTTSPHSPSSLVGRIQSASKKFEEPMPPMGMWDATATASSATPSLDDIRRESFGNEARSGDGQLDDRERRISLIRRPSSQSGHDSLKSPRNNNSKSPETTSQYYDSVPEAFNENQSCHFKTNHQPVVISKVRNEGAETQHKDDLLEHNPNTAKISSDTEVPPIAHASNEKRQDRTTPFDNGYQFPPQHTWTEATMIGLQVFWVYFCTPLGFLVTIYGLNVVAWGGMIFLLLCNAAPEMCHPTCDDINSPRRIWIEYDSQILTALFCKQLVDSWSTGRLKLTIPCHRCHGIWPHSVEIS